MRDLVAVAALEKRVLGLVGPVVEEMGFELVRLRFSGAEAKTLQIMAERASGGMELEDCAEISRAVSAALDVSDPIEGNYNLEVSSPGIDRPLTRISDFGDWAGHIARIETLRPIGGRRRFKGVLQGVSGNNVIVDTNDGSVELEFGSLAGARLVMTDALLEATAAGKDRGESQQETDCSESSISRKVI